MKKRVYYHKLTGGSPILFCENSDKFPFNGEDNSFKVVKFKGSPLRVFAFNEERISLTSPLVESILAIYIGTKKYPMNPKLALNHAIKITTNAAMEPTSKRLIHMYNKIFNED